MHTIIRAAVACLLVAGTAAAAQAQVAAPPVEAYGELPAIERIDISPGGRLAMLATTGGKRMIIALDQDLKPLSAFEIGDVKVRRVDWVGDDALAVIRSDTKALDYRFLANHAELSNVMIFPVGGQGQMYSVFGGDRTMAQAVFGTHGYRQIDGKWVGFFSGIPFERDAEGEYSLQSTTPHLYAVDVASGRTRRIISAGANNEYDDWLIGPDGQIAATMAYNAITDRWRLRDARGRELASGAADGGANVMAFGVDGSTIVYSTFTDDGEVRMFEVPVAGGSTTHLLPQERLDRILVDPRTARMVGYAPLVGADTGDGLEELGTPRFLDPALQQRLGALLAGFAEVGGRPRDWTPDLSRALLATAGNGDSGSWFLVDTRSGETRMVGRSRPQIRPNQVGRVSYVTYPAQDGTQIGAVLTLPPGRPPQNLPVIMFPHGGPRAHDEVTFDWWAQAFASRGYAVLQPNFRGSTGRGSDFMHAGDGEWGRKMQTDLSDGLAFLAQQGTVDPARACIMGASYGGYAALAGVTLQDGIYRCAVSVAGVSDLDVFFSREHRESGRSRALREGWLEMMGPRDQLGTISPRRFANAVNVPVMLIHGRDDTVVPIEQSVIMQAALQQAGKPVEFVELPGEDHWLSRATTRNQMLSAAMAFVQQHNPAE